MQDGKFVEKTLGLRWDMEADTFNFTFVLSPQVRECQQQLKDIMFTKRRVLKVIMSLFYPLGLLACFAVDRCILLHLVQHIGISWDRYAVFLPEREMADVGGRNLRC